MRLVVTGTDTGVGKTIVSAALARPGAAYVKPAQTGDDDDAATVAKLSGAEVFTLARYPEPLAPATAARRAGLPPVTPKQVVAFVGALNHDPDFKRLRNEVIRYLSCVRAERQSESPISELRARPAAKAG